MLNVITKFENTLNEACISTAALGLFFSGIEYSLEVDLH